ncbi:MAG: thioredoxin-dependent thiol peroxidase [Sporolactobacillus sp.]
MLEKGNKAPDFTLESTEGHPLSLHDFKGKMVVLYFYPKDMTPGCTTEACDFRDQNARFADLGAVVLGISADSLERHLAFSEKHGLPFILLSDPEHQTAEAYGAWQLKKNYGKSYYGIVRSTFIIDQAGQIVKVYPKVKVAGHVEDVYDYVKNQLNEQ